MSVTRICVVYIMPFIRSEEYKRVNLKHKKHDLKWSLFNLTNKPFGKQETCQGLIIDLGPACQGASLGLCRGGSGLT